MKIRRNQKAKLVEQFRIRSIQEAAARVIARKGLSGATVEAIAREGGIAKGTIYLYFRDRDHLVESTWQFAAARVFDELEQTLTERRPFREQLRRLLLTKMEFLDRNHHILRAYLELQIQQGHARPRCRRGGHWKQIAAYRRGFASFLKAAMKRGEVRPADPSRLALFVIEGVMAVIHRRLTEKKPPPAGKDVDWIVDLLLHGAAVERGER